MANDISNYVKDDNTLKKTKVNISVFLSGLEHELEPLLKAKNITYSFVPEYKGNIYIDGNQMRRVLINLLNNAIESFEFNSYHSANKLIGIKVIKNKSSVIFSIKDSGPGIPGKIKKRIFEPFIRSGKRKGSGLGLAIVKRIVENHNGNIRFESGPEKGTVFYIELPL